MTNEKKKIAYQSHCRPRLAENDFKIISEQKISVQFGEQWREQDLLTEEHLFTVHYDPFHLQPEDIHSVYPPALSKGDYENHIPQITFMRESIPWERKIFKTQKPLPWMALMLFAKDEDIRTGTMPIKQAFGEAPSEYFVGLRLKEAAKQIKDAKEECMVIDIPFTVLQKKSPLPSQDDLPFMAHIRYVSVEEKESDLFITKGRFANLLANRMPVNVQEDTDYQACLVALDGLEEYYSGGESLAELNKGNYNYMRLILLHQWNFSVEKSVCRGFDELLDHLDRGYMGKEHKAAPSPQTESEQYLSQLIRMGYRPMNYTTRHCKQTVAWYKTPLMPKEPEYQYQESQKTDQETEKQADYRCLNHADGGFAYLKELHMLDVTNGAAWSLGRVVALKNQTYLAALFELRRRHYQEDQQEQNVNLIEELFFEEAQFEEAQEEISTEELQEKAKAECFRLLLAAMEMNPIAESSEEKEEGQK